MLIPSVAERMLRLLRIASTPYPLEPRALVDANSIDDLRSIARDKAGLGFNDQVLRIAYLAWLFGAAGCSHFMETGTYKGITSLAARRLFGTQVFTVEARLSAYLSSRLVALIAGADGIHFERGDSPRVLAAWLSRLEARARPMIYLDAHWFEENPLRRELAVAVERGNCVVVIDDCRVERDPGFGFDSQTLSAEPRSDFTIELASITDMLPATRVVALQPSHAAAAETGRKRGCAILLVDVPLPVDLTFASTLFAPVVTARMRGGLVE